MQIRPLVPQDRDAVVELSLRAWAPVFASVREVLRGSGVYEAQYPHGWEIAQRAAVERVCAESPAWVAVVNGPDDPDGGVVAGFVAIGVHDEGERLGEIHILGVDPERQGAGIGGALTAYAVERLAERGMTSVMVETGGDPGHAPARATYARAGFVQWPVSRWFLAVPPVGADGT